MTALIVAVSLAVIFIRRLFDGATTDYATLEVADSGPLDEERVRALQATLQEQLGERPVVADFGQTVPATDVMERVSQLASEVDADGYNTEDGTRFGEPVLKEINDSSRVLAVLVSQLNDAAVAGSLRDQMRAQGYEAFISTAKREIGGENSLENIVHRVAIGPLLSHTEAKQMRDAISGANDVKARIVEMSQ